MPEFLTEANWRGDFYETPHWIVGMKDNTRVFNADIQLETDPHFTFSESYEFYCRIKHLLTVAQEAGCIRSSRLVVLSSTEAEAVKTFKNGYLSAKVSLMNEYYDLVESVRRRWSSYARLLTLALGVATSVSPGTTGIVGLVERVFPRTLSVCIVSFRVWVLRRLFTVRY